MNPQTNDPQTYSATIQELLESHGGDFITTVKGDSMLPLIRDGDSLQVRPLHSLPQPGDILIFRRSTGLVAHRLLTLNASAEGEYICLAQGDNAMRPDQPVPLSLVAGQAIALHRKESRLSLENPAWRHLGTVVAYIQLLLLRIKARNGLRRGMRACITLLINVAMQSKGI